MQKEINLLPRKNQGFFQKEQTIMIARAIAIFSIIIVFSSFVGTLLLSKNYSLSDVQAQQASVHSRIQLLQNKTKKELLLIDRVQHIQTILKTRSSLIGKITTLQKEISPDITVQSLTVTNQTATITASSSSLSSLKAFLDALTFLVEKKTLFKKITINNVVVDTHTGKYSVSIGGVIL